jgi:putative flippase GtrA
MVKKLFKKSLRNEKVLYLFWGVMTTIVTILSFWSLNKVIDQYLVTSTVSTIIGIIFAYFVNSQYVFKVKHTNYKTKIKEFYNFLLSRVGSLIFEIILMVILVQYLKINETISKIFATFMVVLINYVLMKFFIFKR